MPFSRKFLDSINSRNNRIFYQKVVQFLLNRLLAGQSLSSAELNFACGSLVGMRDTKGERVDVHNFSQCENAIFRSVYVLYSQDLEGWAPKENFFGPVPKKEHFRNISFLENQYQSWLSIISKNNHSSPLLNHIANETNNQLKILHKYCQRNHIGGNRYDHLSKSLVLHGKFIFLIVKEFYEENCSNEIEIHQCGYKIINDSYIYIHTLFRHFSYHLKQHQMDKSYHFDYNIDFKNIPLFIEDIILKYFHDIGCTKFDERKIYLKFKGAPYALWFRSIMRYLKGNIKESVLRAQTFYPVIVPYEAKAVKNLKKVQSSPDLSFLI